MTPRFAAVALGSAALFFATTHSGVFMAGNDASRWAQIESLVEYGSPSIERSRFARTVDRIEVGTRVYSNKFPLFSLVGAAVYWPLTQVTAWRLSDPATAGSAIRWLTFFLVGLPAALGVALFDRALAQRAARERALLVLGLAAGTLVFSFAGTLNPHVPTAMLLFAAALAARDGRPVAAGLPVGFAVAIDLLPGVGFIPFLAWALAFEKDGRARRLAHFGAALIPGLAGMLLANLAITGSWRTARLLPGAVDVAALAGENALGVVLPDHFSYPLELLVGPHGIFAVSPILLLGALGMARALRTGEQRQRHFWRAMAAAMLCQFIGLSLVGGSYGGWSYGYRYLLPIQPLLLFAATFALEAPRRRVVFAALLVPSVLFAALGAWHPWPPGYELDASRDAVARQVRNPIGANAAALAARHLPEAGVTRWLGERFVSKDPEGRRRYFELFFKSRGDPSGVSAP